MIKKLLNKFRVSYFRAVYSIADKLFVGDVCPNCGAVLKFNVSGLGKCQSMYCPECVIHNTTTENRVKAVWTFEELSAMPGFTKDIIDEQQRSMKSAQLTLTAAKKIRADRGEPICGD